MIVRSTVVSKNPYPYTPRIGFTGTIVTQVIDPTTFKVTKEFTDYYVSPYGGKKNMLILLTDGQ
jgi:hypothetical protein